MLKDLNYIAFDFETTGLDYQKDEPIQIGILQFNKDFEVIKTFNTYIRPHRNISELKQIVSFVTGLKLEDLNDAPYIEDVLPQIQSFFCEDTVVIGHNVGFDMNFLNKYIDFEPVARIDTFTLSRVIMHFLPSYALEVVNDVIKDYRFDLDFAQVQKKHSIDQNAHDAMYDSFMCYRFLYHFFSIIKVLISKYPFLSDIVNKSDYYAKFIDLPNSNKKQYALPSLKKEVYAQRKIISQTSYNLSDFHPKSKVFVGNVDFKSLLLGLASGNNKLILSFSNLSKLKIARKTFNEIGIKNIGNLSENLIFNEENISKFLNREKYKDYEINFLIKYLDHVEKNIGYMDLNSVEDYRVYGFLTQSKEKSLPNIVLSTHEGLWEGIKNKDLSDYEIAFFDRDHWYQTFSRYINKTYDFYYLINFLENFIYAQSYQKTGVKNLLKLYNFLLIFVGTLFSEIRTLFKNESRAKIEVPPISQSIDFPKTNGLLLQIPQLLEDIKSELSEQDFLVLKNKFDDYFGIFERIIGINTKMNGNDDFYFIFYQIDNVINYYEFLQVFENANVKFLTDFDTNNSRKINEKSIFSTSRNIKKIDKLDKVLTEIENCQNIFVLSTNKEKSKEIFDKIVDMGIAGDRRVLVDNITGGIGKNVFYAQKTDKKIMIGGYEFIMNAFSSDINIEKIIIYFANGPLEKQIIQDISRY